MQGWAECTPHPPGKLYQTAALDRLLLFDIHAGGGRTDYSFKSHLSVNPQRLHVH